MKSFARAALVATLWIYLGGCSDGAFGDNQIRFLINQGQKQLDSEQVTISHDQLRCGVREELWTIEQLGEDRTIGRLSERARALNFSDDIQIGEQRQPYAQVRGTFVLMVNDIQSVRDVDPRTKLVDARVGVVISHVCFPTPLPLMGVRRGQFTQEAAARFQFRLGGNWEFDRILH